MADLSDLVGELGSAAHDYATRGWRAEVKTNLGPPITVYNAAGGRSLLDLLGVKATLVIRENSSGRVLAAYGDPPPTNPVLVGVLAVSVALGIAAAVVAVRR